MKKIIALIAMTILLSSCWTAEAPEKTIESDNSNEQEMWAEDANTQDEEVTDQMVEEALSEEEINNILDDFFNSVE